MLHHHRVLREALQQAVRWQLVVRNPADAVEPARAAQREMRVLDEQQTTTLVDATKGTRLAMVIFLAP